MDLIESMKRKLHTLFSVSQAQCLLDIDRLDMKLICDSKATSSEMGKAVIHVQEQHLNLVIPFIIYPTCSLSKPLEATPL